MNPFYQALESGYDPEEIIGYISKAMPKVAPMISKARKSGYGIQQILGFLSKTINPNERKGMSQSERIAANRRSDSEMTKYGLKIAASAAVAPLAARAAGSALQRALPSSVTQLLPGMIQEGNISSQSQVAGQGTPSLGQMPQTSQAQNILTQPSQSPLNPAQLQSGPTIPQSAQTLQPINAERDIKKSVDIIKNTGQEPTIKNLIEGGLSPSEIKDTLGVIMGKKKLKELEKATGGIEQALEDYASSITQEKAPIAEKVIESTNALPEVAESLEATKEAEIKPIQKKETVATPKGIGQVKELRNGNALVEVNGKLHKISEEELVQSPLAEKDLADLYNDVIQGIEKETGQAVSRNVDWAGYDPETNELAYRPHGSEKLYVYGDISSDDIDALTNFLTQRKSTGRNFIGAWTAGSTSPIGAAMYQLIKKLQSERGGKGNEYKNRYETIYEALEPAKSAAKRKYEEEKRKAKKPRTS
jgi:hypothetical protein